MNSKQRIGTLNSFASSIQWALVSSLAFVLSGEVSLGQTYHGKRDVPIATDFLACKNSRAALMHFGRCLR